MMHWYYKMTCIVVQNIFSKWLIIKNGGSITFSKIDRQTHLSGNHIPCITYITQQSLLSKDHFITVEKGYHDGYPTVVR